jgi:hypothetical protein
MRRFLLVLVFFGLAGCASGDPGRNAANGACPLIRLAEIPMETHGNLLFVRAQVLGAPVVLLLDTGAQRTLLTEAAVDRLHLPRDYHHATRMSGIGSSPTAAWNARLPEGLTLGGARIPIDTVTVGRFSIGNVAGLADGLLGVDIMRAFDLDLDMANHRLTLYRA